MGYSPWGHKELDMTERLNTQTHTHTHTIVGRTGSGDRPPGSEPQSSVGLSFLGSERR